MNAEETSRTKEPPAKGLCVMQPRIRDRKVKQVWAACDRNVCNEHSVPGVMRTYCM